jgi:hypothetical protein
MMDQTHIGYTNWQQPEKNSMPEVKEIELLTEAKMGIAVEGSESWWPEDETEAVLPEFDKFNQQSYYIEIFNLGKSPFYYSIETEDPWIIVDNTGGKIQTEKRLWISIDWEKAPNGNFKVPVNISGSEGSKVVIHLEVNNPVSPDRDEVSGYVENNGYVSLEAVHYTNAIENSGITWQIIQNLGRTLSSVTPMPVTSGSQQPSGNSPALEYKLHLFSAGEVEVTVYLSPTLNFKNEQGLQYGISFNNEKPQIVNMHEGNTIPDWKYPQWWNGAVSNNVITKSSKHSIKEPGDHVLKFWMVDPGVALQKIVIDTGNLKPSYLGPPESFNRIEKIDKAGL